MKKTDYQKIEKYMMSCMNNRDIAHGKNHVYRVLFHAFELMKHHDVESDILIAACLLHDIGREKELQNPKNDHAIIGSEMAFAFIKSIGWHHEKAEKVKDAIINHRKKSVDENVSIEAKLLYDSDKLDFIGAIGIARYIAHCAMISEPIYITRENGQLEDDEDSFLKELRKELEIFKEKFYTTEAKMMAEQKSIIYKQYHDSLTSEIEKIHSIGFKMNGKYIQ